MLPVSTLANAVITNPLASVGAIRLGRFPLLVARRSHPEGKPSQGRLGVSFCLSGPIAPFSARNPVNRFSLPAPVLANRGIFLSPIAATSGSLFHEWILPHAPHLPLPPRGALAAAVCCFLDICGLGGPFLWSPRRSGLAIPGSTSPYPPSYYGYPLDEIAPTRYGGGNYTRYYAFLPGFGVAGFPEPLPAAVDREFPRLVMGETGFFELIPIRPGPVDVGYLCVRVPEGCRSLAGRST